MSNPNPPTKQSFDLTDRITITTDAYDMMLLHAKQRLPFEACGALAGSLPGIQQHAGIQITAVYAIPNEAPNPNRTFAFSPDAWVNAYYRMQKNRQSLVGFFHSHPTAPPVLSQADLAGLRHSGAETCWILSLANPDSPSVCVYRQLRGQWLPSMFAQVRV
ncbi:Mov34/MPN/PAD-1 family protein [Paenibacillus methanolicus]|uniref:Proteasome lid subunit RPN8/RPN11 n=1 Tax=Paenibacillus methanolicus TaxID=582686 RepID=A0A5S5C3S4_9BACL|nr:proteasome lid subunit RPN8/RPN11 [Paenibacillus methanolicus]